MIKHLTTEINLYDLYDLGSPPANSVPFYKRRIHDVLLRP